MEYTASFCKSYLKYKEESIGGRYINLTHIKPLLETYNELFKIKELGSSVEGNTIYGLTFGQGSKKILMWSQMHGNESTTTKALFDLFKYIKNDSAFRTYVSETFSLCILPMLNPDGSAAYTRVNSNTIDLNRDAQKLSQPESVVLREVFDSFQPDFCFNLHDQRTIFSAGSHPLPATVSFLTPAEDADRAVSLQRKRSMEIVVVMNQLLQRYIPGQVGRYDDGFNLNCVGDTFQSLGVPTILFESGHFQEDYQREQTRMYIAYSLVCALDYIGRNQISGEYYKPYFKIPENDKLFYDVILRDFPMIEKGEILHRDVAILFKESLRNGKVEFIPVVERIEANLKYYGHKDLGMNKIGVKPIEKYEINEMFLTKFLRKI